MAPKKLLILTSILMVGIAGWLYYDQSTVFDGNKRIEAESGVLEASMEVVQGEKLSGGLYIKSAKNPGDENRGTATYRFHIDQHGIYKIKAKSYSHASNGNSFFVKIDDQPEMTWDLGTHYRRWHSNYVTHRRDIQNSRSRYVAEIELTPGTHTLVVKERESYSGLDYFEFEMVKPVVTASFISGFNISQFGKGALALSLMALSLVAIRLSRNSGFLGHKTSAPVDARLNALEKRISDMQEIIISLDEQLRRQQKQVTNETEEA